MKKWITILSVLLGVQLVVTLAVHLTGEDYEAFQSTEKMFSFKAEAVDDLRIEGADGSVVMSKLGDIWVVPDMGDFPADEESVKKLLDKLSNMSKGWPVTTSSSAATRFKTADDEFERKITVRANGEVVALLYVGTSPGFRKVHVRPANRNEIYSVELNTWEIPAGADGWIDKKRAAVKQEMVAALKMPGFELQRVKDKWTMPGLSETEEVDQKKAGELLRELSELPIQSVLGSELKPEYLQDKPSIQFQVILMTGEPLDYTVSKPEGESYYVLKRSDLGFYFKMAEFSVKPFLEAERAGLVGPKTEEPAAEEAVSEDAAVDGIAPEGAAPEQVDAGQVAPEQAGSAEPGQETPQAAPMEEAPPAGN